MNIPKPFLNLTSQEWQVYLERFISFLSNPPYSLEAPDLVVQEVFDRSEDIRKAWKLIEDMKGTPLTTSKIIQVGNQVNEENPYISRGYRKIGNILEETKTPISEAHEIPNKMEKLVEDYHHTWEKLSPFEREARFFLGMIRIHPFEDGNRRTAFLFVNAHLLKEGYAPIYMTGNIYQRYLNNIAENRIEDMNNLFEEQSYKEAMIFERRKDFSLSSHRKH